MSMSRKDYQAVAKVLREEREDWGSEGSVQLALSYVASRLAGVFADDNARFDRDKFLAAAGASFDSEGQAQQ